MPLTGARLCRKLKSLSIEHKVQTRLFKQRSTSSEVDRASTTFDLQRSRACTRLTALDKSRNFSSLAGSSKINRSYMKSSVLLFCDTSKLSV